MAIEDAAAIGRCFSREHLDSNVKQGAAGVRGVEEAASFEGAGCSG